MEDAGGEGEPLLPPARELAGELGAPVGQPRPGEHGVDALGAIRELVEPGDEVQVLLDGEVLVEREALGHVPDPTADARGVAPHVEPEAGALAGIGRQQSAEHPQGGGLPAAVRAEEAAESVPWPRGGRGPAPPDARRTTCTARARRWRAGRRRSPGHLHVERLARMEALQRRGPRLDQVHELAPGVAGVDHRRGVLGAGGDVAHLRVERTRASVAGDAHRGADGGARRAWARGRRSERGARRRGGARGPRRPTGPSLPSGSTCRPPGPWRGRRPMRCWSFHSAEARAARAISVVARWAWISCTRAHRGLETPEAGLGGAKPGRGLLLVRAVQVETLARRGSLPGELLGATEIHVGQLRARSSPRGPGPARHRGRSPSRRPRGLPAVPRPGRASRRPRRGRRARRLRPG